MATANLKIFKIKTKIIYKYNLFLKILKNIYTLYYDIFNFL